MAALRYYQAEGLGDERIEDVATASGKFQALDTHKIDALCDLINRAPITLPSPIARKVILDVSEPRRDAIPGPSGAVERSRPAGGA